MSTFKDLQAYKKAFELAMDIFELTKQFPKEEKYSLVDQIRRSSRSVCVCLAEGYRKRRYSKHFLAKISDADMENAETQSWLQFSLACNYINHEAHEQLLERSQEVGKILGFMMRNPRKFI